MNEESLPCESYVRDENEFSIQNLGQNSNFTAEDTKVKRIFISQLGSIVPV